MDDSSRPHTRASDAGRLVDLDATDTIPRAGSNWQLPEIQPQTPGITDDRTIPISSPGKAPRRGVSRRKVLIGAGAGAVGLGLLGTGAAAFLARQQSASPATLYADDAAKVGHLLRRAGFGSSPADLRQYLSLGVSGALDKLLNFSGVSTTALDARLNSLNLNFTNRQDLIRWVLLRMIYSPRPFEEKLTLFWHGVLTSSFTKIGGNTH